MILDPLKTIKEHKQKGYLIELSVDSVRPNYQIYMYTQSDVKNFTVPIKDISIERLHRAMRA